MLVFFGLMMLQTFVLFFVRDVQHVDNPSAGTALYAFSTIGGAVVSSIYLGLLSDRVPRKIITALAIGAMAFATIGFALAPELGVDAAVCGALRHRFRRRDVERLGARDGRDSEDARRRARSRSLGHRDELPNIVAPLVGGWLIGLFGGTRAGYQAVFGLAGFSFALASLSVLRVGRRPLSSLWALAVALCRGHRRTTLGIISPIACDVGASSRAGAVRR